MKRTNEKGITLISLVVTISLILILTSIGIVSFYNKDTIEGAKDTIEYYNKKQEEKSLDELSVNLDSKTKKQINKPNLKTGMIPVKWVNNSERETTKDDSEWYNYAEGDNKTDNKNSKWANAKLDGSYFVWIPRFAYKITYYTSQEMNEISPGKTDYGKIDVKFLIGISDYYYDEQTSTTVKAQRYVNDQTEINTQNQYTVHPAFTNEIDALYKNGGTNKELDGIWVAKYEMSMETNGTNTNTNTELQGNVNTSNSIKIVSKPNERSWRFINASNAYTNSLNYNKEANSHLIKDSEWGAVAYLAHSQYGRNTNQIEINNSSTYTTATGNGSTTGNITGVYDMNGGASEIVSAYLGNGNSNGTEIINGNVFYKNVYSNNIGKVFGNAIYETSGWFGDNAIIATQSSPFILRGGKYNEADLAGIFAYDNSDGTAKENGGFRVVLY